MSTHGRRRAPRGSSTARTWAVSTVAAAVLLSGGAAMASQGWVPTPKREADLRIATPTVAPTPSPTAEPSAVARPQAVRPALPMFREEKTEAKSRRGGGGDARLARKVERLSQKSGQAPSPTTSFRVASINTLGDSHTRPGGNKPGYASGAARTRTLAGILRDQNVDVAGLQEFEDPQKAAFNRVAPEWTRFTGTERGRDSIVWRSAVWEQVAGGTRSIPYFRNPAPLPWVTLRHRTTQREVSFISLHNPTSNPRRGNNQGERTEATRREIALVRDLAAGGDPVLLLGDFNEKAEAFCMVTGGGDIGAANGGSTGGGCSPPPNMGIDWIFGTVDIAFSEYLRLRNARTSSMTDHPVILARATIEEPLPSG
ncbi:MAG: endonuclease/exonuclease/phosphatase family protein [Nocardioides sp.]